MRENRTHGSEGGEDESPSLPLSKRGVRDDKAAVRDDEAAVRGDRAGRATSKAVIAATDQVRGFSTRDPIGVEKDTVLPSLRTVRAVLPHTALQSVVSSSGLARLMSDLRHGEQAQICEVCIWPACVIGAAQSHSRSLFLLAQDRAQSPADESVQS